MPERGSAPPDEPSFCAQHGGAVTPRDLTAGFVQRQEPEHRYSCEATVDPCRHARHLASSISLDKPNLG